MNVIVTGHKGFVGSHLTQVLKDAGHTVIGFDKIDGDDLAMVQGDQGWAWDYVPVQADLIIHLASTCSTLGSILRPEETFRDTVMTTVTVCRWARELKVPLVVTSSVKARDGLTPYGAAKVMSETWAFESGLTHGFPVIVNRPGTIYGPGQEGSLESGWIAWFLKAKRKGFPVVINGSGEQRRDLLYVSDYVDLLMAQVSDPEEWASEEPWDVGGGERNTVSVVGMADYLGLKHSFGPRRYGDAAEYVGLNDIDPKTWRPKVYWKESGMFPKP